MSFQRVFKQESDRIGATNMLAGRVTFGLRQALPLVREVYARIATARTFALLVWFTCAIATFPTSSPHLKVAPEVEALQHTDDTAQSPSVTAERVVAPSEPRGLTPTQGDLATVSSCWAGEQMHIKEAWQIAGAPKSVLVAVLDTGIETHCSGLTERVGDSVNLVQGTDARDHYGHGTLVAATIAAIAPNSTLLNIKVADDRGFCRPESVAKGIRMATRRGAAVINLSLDVEPSPEIKEAIEEASARGIVLVASCGTPDLCGSGTVAANDASIRYPAGYPEVIAVASVSCDGVLSPPTARAWWVDVAAPGEKTSVVLSDGIELCMSGTSFAAAHVSGLAALLCGLATDTNNNECTNDEVRRALECTVQPIDAGGLGTGMVDARAAVEFISR